MSHLGESVSAFVDGQLDPEEEARAEAHIALCSQCQAAVLAEGATRRKTRSTCAVGLDEDLAAKLIGLAPTPERENAACGSGATDAQPSREVALQFATPKKRTATRVALALVASSGVLAVSLFVLGGQENTIDDLSALTSGRNGAVAAQSSGQPTVWQGGQTLPDGKTSSLPDAIRQVGAVAPLAADGSGEGSRSRSHSARVFEQIRRHGWVAPAVLPRGVAVMAVDDVGGAAKAGPAQPKTMRLWLASERGLVTISEQAGVLDDDFAATLDHVMVSGREVYREDSHTWLVQCGDRLVALHSTSDPHTVKELIAQLPAPRQGVFSRMGHGLDVLTGRG